MMRTIIKKIYIRTLGCIYDIKLWCYKLLYSNINFGKHVRISNVKFDRKCSIVIGDNVKLENCSFHVVSPNKITINSFCELHGVTFWMDDANNSIEIGRYTTMVGPVQLAACEQASISIGEDCMFAHDIYVRTTDSHSIIGNSGNRINMAKDVKVGNHVWVGMQSIFLKGSTVGDNSVIAARTIVSSSTPNRQNAIIVGSPARVLRDDINWCRDRLEFTKQ